MPRRNRSTRRRIAAAGVMLACTRAAWAATPTFNSGQVVITHDLNASDAINSKNTTFYNSVTLTPTTTLPGTYQLNDATANNGYLREATTPGIGTSSAVASVARVENSTTLGITLAGGTGVAQGDPGHDVGDSVLRININDLKWTAGTSFGPPASGYFSVTLAGAVNGTLQFSTHLTFTDAAGNNLRSAISFGNDTYTPTSTSPLVLPRTYTSSVLFNGTYVPAGKQINLNGYIEFRANNGTDLTSLAPTALEIGTAPPTATWFSDSGGNWNDAANWTAPANSVTEDPDGTIPTIPNGADQRARFALPPTPTDPLPGGALGGPAGPVTLTTPITLGTLEVDQPSGSTFDLAGGNSTTLSFATNCPEVHAVIDHRGIQGNSALVIDVPVNAQSALDIMANSTGGVSFTNTVTGASITKYGPGALAFGNVALSNLNVSGGTTSITGAGSFSTVTIDPTGVLSVGNGSAGGSVGGMIVDNGAIVFNRSDAHSFSGTIIGAGSLEKRGAGTFTLGSGAYNYTGATTVSAGKMILAGSLGNSPTINLNGGTLALASNGTIGGTTQVNIAPGAALDVSAFTPFTTPSGLTIAGTGGTVFGNVNHVGGLIDPGGKLAVGTVNFNNNLVINGGKLRFDLGTAATIGGGVNDLVKVTGNTVLTSGTVSVEMLGPSASAGSAYTLIDNTTIVGTAANLALVNNTRAGLTLSNTGTQLLLQVGLSGAPAPLIWTGSSSSNWDVNSSQNWLNTSSSTFDKFYTSDLITFNDSTTVTSVNLAATLRPTSVTVNSSSNNFTFSGSGKLTGSMSLTKSGGSTLTINTTNDYTGGTSIGGGAVKVSTLADGGSASPIGASSNLASNLILDGGTLHYAGLGQSTDRLFSVGTGGATLNASGTGPVNFTNPGAIGFNGQSGARSLTLDGSNTADNILNASIGDSGGATSVVKNGSGAWVLTGSHTYSGNTTINAGILRMDGTHTGGSSYEVNSGGTLAGVGSIDAQVNLNSGGVLAPGSPAGIGALTVGSLNLNGGDMSFRVDSSGADNAIVTAPDGLSLGHDSTISLSNLGSAAPGTYSLIQYAGAYTGSFGDLSLASSTLGGYSVSLVDNTAGLSIDLQIQSISGTWTNAGAGNWSTGANWGGAVPNSADQIANFGNAITAPTTITVDAPKTIAVMNFDSAHSYLIAGSSTLTIDATGTQAAINVLQGNHTISAPLVLNRGTQFNVGTASTLAVTGSVTSAVANIEKLGAGTAQFAGMHVAALMIDAGTVQILSQPTANSPAGVSVIKSLHIAAPVGTISSGGTLDLTNNSMIINYGGEDCAAGFVADDVRKNLLANRLITSSGNTNLRLGYGDNAVLNQSTFAGVAVDSDNVLVKFTYAGDANLDGTVDMTDIYMFSQHWLQSGQVWTAGDFNYDGTVNAVDLGYIALNWQAGVNGGALGDSFDDALSIFGLPPTAVPEPVGLASLMLLAYPLKRTRRRRVC